MVKHFLLGGLILICILGCETANQFTYHYVELETMYRDGKLTPEEYIKAKKEAMEMDPSPSFAKYYQELQAMYQEKKFTSEQYVKAKQDAMAMQKYREQQQAKAWQEAADKIKQESDRQTEEFNRIEQQKFHNRIEAMNAMRENRVTTDCITNEFGKTHCQ